MRRAIVLSGMAMAEVAAWLLGPQGLERPLPKETRHLRGPKPKKFRKRIGRDKKQYLLKGIRP